MLEGGPRTGLVYTWSICIDQDGNPLYTYPRWRQEGAILKALIHINFIGPNGSGKSTLLRLIGGVMVPDEGRISVHGRVGGLIHLGAGSHSDLSGRENIFISGIINETSLTVSQAVRLVINRR